MYRFLFGPLTCGTIAITFGDWAATPPSTTSSSSRSSQQQHHATDSSNIGDDWRLLPAAHHVNKAAKKNANSRPSRPSTM